MKTGLDLFGTDKNVIAIKVDGELKDIYSEVSDGQQVEPVELNSADGLAILRHSATHIMAQAVQNLYKGVNLGVGPVIDDGFFYDFEIDTAFSPDDLKTIEKEMLKIVNANQEFRRKVVSKSEAEQLLKDEPFKIELINIKDNLSDEEKVEVGATELTIYENVDKSGKTVWQDLCRGPHLPNTKILANNFRLMRTSGAYWRGDEANEQLQRIYGTAWATKDDLKSYLHRLEEAEKRDHRKLGIQLDLFSFPDELGSGLPIFHPKGGIVRTVMEDYSRKKHLENGYSFVNTPHITKGGLYETSGHLAWYKDTMFPPMRVDRVLDKDGHVKHEGVDYYLKPMNCPMHNLIFRHRSRSYKELPLRLFEFGSVYRYEKSGVIHGLTRVRGMTQDDAHIYCTKDQMADELTSLLEFVLSLLADYGLDDFYLELSTKNPDKYVGSDAVWEEATQTLEKVARASGLELVADPGGAAFYGPKISVQCRDAIGRTWQMSTIQLDFNLPELFNLQYQAPNGELAQPVMIHRALFGSIERFFGVLTEHYAGAYPAWLAPVQVLGIPVADEFNDYLQTVLDKLTVQGIRSEMDLSDDRFGKKIRNASKSKVPFVLIAGEEDVKNKAVSFRFRDGSQENGVSIDAAIKKIVEHIESRKNSDK
ncbi:MAG: threonine--tRNA ligase [Bifidobacteriaceae bacterium]|jgi:threonyl-tRNA synthetase|nr:threonine--tRNA ligase [Bifidobacteriaceae bacterium]